MTETERPSVLLLYMRRCLLATVLTIASCLGLAGIFAQLALPGVVTLLFVFSFWWCGVWAVAKWLQQRGA